MNKKKAHHKKRRSVPREEQIAWLDRHEASGLSVAEFCEQHGLAAQTFYVWRGVHRRVKGRRPPTRSKIPEGQAGEFVMHCELHGVKSAAERWGMTTASAYKRRERMKAEGRWNTKGEPRNGAGTALAVAPPAAPAKVAAAPSQLKLEEAQLETAFERDHRDAWDELSALLRPLPPKSRIRVLSLVDEMLSQ